MAWPAGPAKLLLLGGGCPGGSLGGGRGLFALGTRGCAGRLGDVDDQHLRIGQQGGPVRQDQVRGVDVLAGLAALDAELDVRPAGGWPRPRG